jgi:hypothetical protein
MSTALLPLVAIRWLPGGREARQTAHTRRRQDTRMAGAALRLPLIFAALAAQLPRRLDV